MVRSLTWALECDRPQRRRSVLLQVLEVDRDEGRRLTRRTRRSKFDEASFNVLVNRQDQVVYFILLVHLGPFCIIHNSRELSAGKDGVGRVSLYNPHNFKI